MITVKTSIDSTTEEVWRAYTSPEDIKMWNFASDEWHCPAASNDLREGGAFNYRMEAKDGSMGFDFFGEFTRIEPQRLLEYKMEERRARVEFEETDAGVDVTVAFDSDNSVPEDMQKAGWQAILDNFKRHVESRS